MPKQTKADKPAAENRPVRKSTRNKTTETPAEDVVQPPQPKKAKVTKKAEEDAPKETKMEKKHIAVGDQMPAIVLTDHTGKEVDLEHVTKNSGVVIFFYPKANTPGCTTQACQYRDEKEDFKSKGYAIYGCSADSPKSLSSTIYHLIQDWKDKHNFNYDLLSDPEYKLIGSLGMKKSATGGVIRSHVVIKKGGEIGDIRIQISPKVANYLIYCKDSSTEAMKFITNL